MKAAEIFCDWVCEVLESIRKTGSYNSQYFYNQAIATQNDVRELAAARGREDALHYRVIDHIKATYPDAMIQAGLGEHLTTKHARLDAKLKGYSAGEPDITIKRKLPNGFQDNIAIELKNPNGTGELSENQKNYHRLLKENCNIETIVGHNYDDIIIAIHDHYKDVFARAQTPAIADQPEPKYDFATNDNPKYWCNKLKNGTALMHECEKRGIPKDEIYIKTNREIASILITFDKEQNND